MPFPQSVGSDQISFKQTYKPIILGFATKLRSITKLKIYPSQTLFYDPFSPQTLDIDLGCVERASHNALVKVYEIKVSINLVGDCRFLTI